MIDLKEYSYNKGFQWYERTVVFEGAPLHITLNNEIQKDNAILEERLKQTIGKFLKNPEALLEFCATQLLETKNSEWLNDGETKLTAGDFKKQLKLKQININADGSASFYYNAGMLFRGHVVVAEVKPDFTFDYANMEG